MYENDLHAAELACKLMHDVYHPFTASLFFDENGRVCDLYLFDTLYCQPVFPVKVLAHQCVLISHHFDGNTQPYAEDLRSIQALRSAYPDIICILMIYSEYTGLLTVKEACSADERESVR